MIMNKKMRESMKGMSREERAVYLQEHKAELVDSLLASVNGGAAKAKTDQNPNSDIVPYKDRWITSWGYICDGEEVCY